MEPLSRVWPQSSPPITPSSFLLLLTSHPEHAGGEPGFPPCTIIIRDAVQQQEMEKHGQEMIEMFSKFSAQNKELLAGVVCDHPNGNLRSRKLPSTWAESRPDSLWFGGAHTKGDELTFVEPDRTLISGDVVQNQTMPNIFGDGGTPASWWLCWIRSPASTPHTSCPTTALPETVRW